MSKQTAVEWLVQELKAHDFSPSDGMVKINIPLYLLEEKQSEAKAMEREQIVEAWCDEVPRLVFGLKAEKYYERNYGKEASHE